VKIHTTKNVIAKPKSSSGLDWIYDLELMLDKHSGLGIEDDVANMSESELWGVYQWLSSLQES